MNAPAAPTTEEDIWHRNIQYSSDALEFLTEIMEMKDLFSIEHLRTPLPKGRPFKNFREFALKLRNVADLMRADKELNVYAVSVLLLLVAPPKSVYEVAAYLRARFSAEVTVAILWCLGDWEFREAGEWFECIQHGQGNEEILYMEDYTDND